MTTSSLLRASALSLAALGLALGALGCDLIVGFETPSQLAECLPDGGTGTGEPNTVLTTADNCGGCGVTCGTGEVCSDLGACLCEGETPSEGGLGGGSVCASLGLDDPSSDYVCCGSGCADLQRDPSNCGTCGTVCVEGFLPNCVEGECVGDIVTVASGAGHSCALLRSDGLVYCWGDNRSAQMGRQSGESTQADPLAVRQLTRGDPSAAPSLNGATALDLGDEFGCALVSAQGNVWCWGDNSREQIGNGGSGLIGSDPLAPAAVPVRLESFDRLDGATALAVGSRHACVLRGERGVDRSLLCWGDNAAGQLGLSSVMASTPSPIELCGDGSCGFSPVEIHAIAAGGAHTCVIAGSDREVFCWGENGEGQLGDGSGMSSSTPVAVCAEGETGCAEGSLTGALAIAAGGAHTCALIHDAVTDTDRALCWGRNGEGQLGLGTTTGPGDQSLSPQITLLSGTIRDLSLGEAHSCVNLGTQVRCWGAGGAGQLGADSLSNSAEPLRVRGLDADATFSAVSAGGRHSCSIVRGRQIDCWGENTLRQLATDCSSCPDPEDAATCGACEGIAPRLIPEPPPES